MLAPFAALALIRGATLLAQHQLVPEHNRAWELGGRQHFDIAIPKLQALIKRDPKFFLPYQTLADVYMMAGRAGSGLSYFNNLAQHVPENAFAYYALSRLHAARHSHTEAAANMRLCAEREDWAPETIWCMTEFPDLLMTSRSTKVELSDLPARMRDPSHPRAVVIRASLQSARFERTFLKATSENCLEEARRRAEPLLLVVCVNRFPPETFDPVKPVDIMLRLGYRNAAVDTIAVLAQLQCQSGAQLEADRLLDRYRSMIESWAHPRTSSTLWIAEEACSRERGEHESAVRFLRKIAALPESPAIAVSRPEVFKRIGDHYRRLGLPQQAGRAYEESLREALREGRPIVDRAFAYRALGDLETEMGQFFQALEHHRHSRNIFESSGGLPSRLAACASLIRIGKLEALLGDLTLAQETLQQALAEAFKTQYADPQQRGLLELGAVYLKLGQPEKALAELQRSQEAGLLNQQSVFTAPTLINVGRALRALERNGAATKALEEAIEVSRRLRNTADEAEALAELGASLRSVGRTQEAENRLLAALELAGRAGSLSTIVAARQTLAELVPAKAAEHIRAAIDAVEAMRNRIPGANLRASFSSQTAGLFERAIDLNRANTAQSFELAERGRARAFLDLIAEASAHVSNGLSAPQAARQQELVARVSRAAATYAQDATDRHRREVDAAERVLQAWVTELYHTNPAYSQLRYPVAAGLQKIQACLDSETALISFAVMDARTIVWVVKRNSVEAVELAGREPLTEMVRSYRTLIGRRPQSMTQARQYRDHPIHLVLGSSLERHISGLHRLVIVPDGMLHYLPFETLLTADGRHMVEKFTIAYVPSATVFTALRDHAPDSRPEFLGFGDPVFAHSNGATQSEVRSFLERAGFGIGALPNARDEVEGIAAAYSARAAKVFVGESATEEALKREARRGYRKVHLAAHALIDEQSPLRSGILLTPSPKDDGLLTMAEMFDLRLRSDLVVLSACQTGLGRIVRGEGMIGLTRALFHAGVPRVVVSLWEVNDLATSQFMNEFYRALRSGQPVSTAIRDAKLKMLQGEAVSLRHPYFWGPFVLIGRP